MTTITLTKGQVQGIKDAPEEFMREQKKKKMKKRFAQGRAKTAQQQEDMSFMKEGGMVVKDKIVAIDKSPNSGLITVKGFGAGRRT